MLVLVSFLFPMLVAGNSAPTTALPKEWQGSWQGTLKIRNSKDKESSVAIGLEIQPIKATRHFTWKIIYGEGDKKSVRDYKLVPIKEMPGRFHIDEGNGILLDARLVDNVIYSQFRVGDAMLTARYELRGTALLFEITSAKASAKKIGKGMIQGYLIQVVQSAVMKKK